MATLNELGEIVTWESPPAVGFQTLRNALQQSGIDPELACELLPRYAFSRAAKELDDNRVIKQANEDDQYLWFQFTKEYFDKTQHTFQYNFETKLRLNKTTGDVDCPDQNLRTTAYNLVMQKMGQRSSSDVTRIVQKLFKKMSRYGDLFPIRKQGGAYFVPAHYRHLVDQIDQMMAAIGGKLTRWEIQPSVANQKSAGETISDAVAGLIEDYDRAIDEYMPNEGTQEAQARMVRRVVEIQGMATAYKDYLGDLSESLSKKLGESLVRLQDKIAGKSPPPQPAKPQVDPDLIRRLNAALGRT